MEKQNNSAVKYFNYVVLGNNYYRKGDYNKVIYCFNKWIIQQLIILNCMII